LSRRRRGLCGFFIALREIEVDLTHQWVCRLLSRSTLLACPSAEIITVGYHDGPR